MGSPAAKQGDQVVATDIHIVLVPAPPGPPIPTPLPHPFNGVIKESLSSDVKIMGMPAATVDSIAVNIPHIPTPPGIAFQIPPKNKGTILKGSGTVKINGKPAARNSDTALTCNDPADMPAGKVIAKGTVHIG